MSGACYCIAYGGSCKNCWQDRDKSKTAFSVIMEQNSNAS